MNKVAICAAVIALTISVAGNAQQAKVSDKSSNAVYAYAKGDDSYLLFSKDTYKAEKKYIVIKFWNEQEPLSEREKTELATLKKQLAAKNVEIVDFQWSKEEDLKAVLNKYGLSVQVLGQKRINVKNDNMNLNTTSGKALFVLEDDKPLSLCSGPDCEANLKTFFQL